ncbi:hypothetical protein CQA44_09915, partial [Helicobacter sp. MIT 14-3879]
MFDLVLISVNNPAILGIYSSVNSEFSQTTIIDSNIVQKNIFSNSHEAVQKDTKPDSKLLSSLQIEGNIGDTLPFLFGNILIKDTHLLESFNAKFQHYPCKIQDTLLNTKSHNNHQECESLSKIISVLQSIDSIGRIYYARGVGSLSAIKLTHIFLQT